MALELIPVNVEGDGLKNLQGHIRNRLRELETTLKPLHTTMLPEWRRAYEARPLESVREFPFHNASNLIVPVIAIHRDTLLARVMAAVFKTQPIWVARMLGNHPDITDDIREALEEFLSAMAIEPTELDLMRVYEQWIGDTISYGTNVVKTPWLKDVIWQVSGDGTGGHHWMPNTRYEGPRPEAIPFEDMWVPLGAKTLESADFISHRRRMLRWEVEELRQVPYFEKKDLDKVLAAPDRTTPFITQSTAQADMGAQQSGGNNYQEFDIHESWFEYRDGDRKARIISHYHLQTDTLLRAVYDTYPQLPFVASRLFLRDNMFYGYGFAEKLGQFQEEISIMHNQRRDAVTVSEMVAWRVDPDSTLHAGYKIYPSCMLPGKKDEIEPLKMGEPGPISIEEEHLTLDLAERLSGISPPMQGMGAGANTKRGVYSAMGTLSLLQEGNTRTDLNVSDIRYAHTKLARLLAVEYARFGSADDIRFQQFGKDAGAIWASLQAVLNRKVALPVHASNASVNREVEKQNDLMLSRIAMAHFQAMTQMMMSLASPQVPPNVREYVTLAIQAANRLQTEVFKHFGYDEPHRFVPEIPDAQDNAGNPQGNPQDGNSGGGKVLAMRSPGAQGTNGVPGGSSGVPGGDFGQPDGASGAVPGAGVLAGT